MKCFDNKWSTLSIVFKFYYKPASNWTFKEVNKYFDGTWCTVTFHRIICFWNMAEEDSLFLFILHYLCDLIIVFFSVGFILWKPRLRCCGAKYAKSYFGNLKMAAIKTNSDWFTLWRQSLWRSATWCACYLLKIFNVKCTERHLRFIASIKNVLSFASNRNKIRQRWFFLLFASIC